MLHTCRPAKLAFLAALAPCSVLVCGGRPAPALPSDDVSAAPADLAVRAAQVGLCSEDGQLLYTATSAGPECRGRPAARTVSNPHAAAQLALGWLQRAGIASQAPGWTLRRAKRHPMPGSAGERVCRWRARDRSAVMILHASNGEVTCASVRLDDRATPPSRSGTGAPEPRSAFGV